GTSPKDTHVVVERAIPTEPGIRASRSLYLSETEHQGVTPSRQMLKVGPEPAAAHIAARLGVAEGADVVVRRELMSANGIPIRGPPLRPVTPSGPTPSRSGPGARPPSPFPPRASATEDPPAGGEELRSLAAAGTMVPCRRREMARLAVEPALAPGWGLWWPMRCREGDSSRSSRSLRSHSMNSSLVTWPVGCGEDAGQRLHWPASRSCLQRSFMAGRTLRNP